MTDLFDETATKPKRGRAKAEPKPDAAAAAKPEQEVLPPEDQPPSTELVAADPAQARLVLLDREQFDQFYERVREEVRKADELDPNTPAGRAEIVSLAFKVTKTKTAIDKSAKELTEGWRQQTNLVNATRRAMVDRLAALANEVRRPVTEWEQREAARIERCRAKIEWLIGAAAIAPEDTSATVDARGGEVWNTPLDEAEFGDLLDEARAAKDATVKALVSARDRLLQEEADKAELTRLRAAEAERLAREEAERAEREQREAAEREAREAREKAEQEARAAEERRKAEEDRIARERAEAAERARDEERRRLEAEKEAELAAERERAEAAEAEARRLRDDEAARQAAAEADARAAAQRERDKAHRRQIMSEVKAALLTVEGMTEPQAKAIVVAIVAGQVPHTAIAF